MDVAVVVGRYRGCRHVVGVVGVRQVALALAPGDAGPHRGVHVTHRARQPNLRDMGRGRGGLHRIIVVVIVFGVCAEGVSEVLHDADQLGGGQRLTNTEGALTHLRTERVCRYSEVW